ncbi:hypothetical protein FHX71_003876 [Promicromonospora sukumoe]|uniref:DUF6891 domain-containing protein n=2 Tax=Promicromonospora sukumoe TaxID=88382 RepID=A0A7W3JBP2_9MICO|nr:hypothetical protein [Promicromonospora sukumoe]MBA8809900.1 hypothetical protein [Promicromonospora sukumoe]
MTEMNVAPPSDGDQLRYVRQQVRAMVRAGFTPFDRVLQAADEMLESDAGKSLRAAAGEAARQEWQARVVEQASWADEGSYPALATAFADLESLGVVARMSFACCNTCGATEIHDEADPNGPEPLGYTFFHSQEADRLGDTPGDLFLSFGGFDETPAAVIGDIVATTVARHGFDVDWAGDAGAKVQVRVPDWRKRLPGDVPLAVPARLRVLPERGAPSLDPTPYDLLVHLHEVRRGRQQFVVVEDTTNGYRFAQSALDDDGQAFVVEHRESPDGPIHRAICPDLALAHKVLIGWCTGENGWRDLTGWTQIEL